MELWAWILLGCLLGCICTLVFDFTVFVSVYFRMLQHDVRVNDVDINTTAGSTTSITSTAGSISSITSSSTTSTAFRRSLGPDWPRQAERYRGDDLDMLGGVRFPGRSDREAEWRCAICLCNSGGDHEKLRELSVCKHVFHKVCIDSWFLMRLRDIGLKEPCELRIGTTKHLSRLVCPLCRAPMIPAQAGRYSPRLVDTDSTAESSDLDV